MASRNRSASALPLRLQLADDLFDQRLGVDGGFEGAFASGRAARSAAGVAVASICTAVSRFASKFLAPLIERAASSAQVAVEAGGCDPEWSLGATGGHVISCGVVEVVGDLVGASVQVRLLAELRAATASFVEQPRALLAGPGRWREARERAAPDSKCGFECRTVALQWNHEEASPRALSRRRRSIPGQ